jgi:hypothetical protein
MDTSQQPTPLLAISAQTTFEKSTVGQKEQSPIGGTLPHVSFPKFVYRIIIIDKVLHTNVP